VSHVNAVSFTIVVALFVIVVFAGLAAARWRRAEDILHLTEWGLGGRSFGTFVSWFVLGGDLYTAYTFIAVPAVVFGTGSAGFFAVSYTIMVFPIAIIFVPRLWSVCRANDWVTPADFIRGRYGSRGLALAAALTGILALMPYIALQLVGIKAVLTVLGLGNSDVPLIIAFLALAAYTYVSGLRAPALISFVKDTLIYVMIIVAVLYIPTRLGGWGHIFGVAQTHLKATNPTTHEANGLFVPTTTQSQLAFGTLSLGSALALFIYPHTITGALAAKRREVINRNMSLLPIYSVMLAFVALLGYMALADKTTTANVAANGKNAQLAVPFLFQHMFPSWFAGLAFSAIIIGALVPAAIMSIAAANLFTRNVYVEFFKRDATPRHEARVSQTVSLVVKLGALVFALGLSRQFSINLQLLGGMWILQVLPALMIGLFTRWFHRWALLAGWAAGMIYGTIAAYDVSAPGNSHFGGSTDHLWGMTLYFGLTALLLNLAIVVLLTSALRGLRVPEGHDSTRPEQYTYDPAAPRPSTQRHTGRHRSLMRSRSD
jgi:solute:Na+ symporter, SSS family